MCGGLTTFSTMQIETLKMIEHHHYGLAIEIHLRQHRFGVACRTSGVGAGSPGGGALTMIAGDEAERSDEEERRR